MKSRRVVIVRSGAAALLAIVASVGCFSTESRAESCSVRIKSFERVGASPSGNDVVYEVALQASSAQKIKTHLTVSSSRTACGISQRSTRRIAPGRLRDSYFYLANSYFVPSGVWSAPNDPHAVIRD